MARSKPAENTLLQRVSEGDASAVNQVLDRYSALVWSIVRQRLDARSAEDIVQEIFIDVWRSAPRYDPQKSSEATFIATIARRRLIDFTRRERRRPEREELFDVWSDGSRSVQEELEVADEARVASEAIEKLKPAQRKVLQMSIVDGFTHTQIAEITRLPLGTVKSHARRGLERVRSMLSPGPDPNTAASSTTRGGPS